MAARPNRYPTLAELRNMSNQELFDKKLIGMTAGQAGAIRS